MYRMVSLESYRVPMLRGGLMEEGSSHHEAGDPPRRSEESAADNRFPLLTEEYVSNLEQIASGELDQKPGSQVRLIRSFAAFLEPKDSSSQDM